jgi:hypothetical protein
LVGDSNADRDMAYLHADFYEYTVQHFDEHADGFDSHSHVYQYANADTDQHTDEYTDEYTYVYTNLNLVGDSNADRDMAYLHDDFYEYTVQHSDENADGYDSHSHVYQYANADTDQHTDEYADFYEYTVQYFDEHADRLDSYPHLYQYANPDTDQHIDEYAYGYSDCHLHLHDKSDQNGDAHAD